MQARWAARMSAMGHQRTFCDAKAMSALPPKADNGGALEMNANAPAPFAHASWAYL
jgi:hypothetical protein